MYHLFFMVTHKAWKKNLLIKYLCPRDFSRGEMEEIMKNFYKWINKWENNYIEKKLKELDEHPERNKTSSGILEETLIFLFFAIFFGCIIYFMPGRTRP